MKHIRTHGEDRKESLNSDQEFLAGKEGKPASRMDAIRALRRAEKLCPAPICGTPPDGGLTIDTSRIVVDGCDTFISSYVEAKYCLV